MGEARSLLRRVARKKKRVEKRVNPFLVMPANSATARGGKPLIR